MSQLLEMLSSKVGYERADTFEQYLRNKAFEKGIPLIGHFELTPRCTLDCVMCYVHLSRTQMYCNELKTEEWISLIDQACDAGMIYATITGGECFLYPGFREIYDHLQSRGVFVTVLTNGTLLDDEMVRWLAERSPRRVQLSVYGSSPKGYENVTGNGEAFYIVDRAIDLLLKAKIPLCFAVTISKQIMPDFEAILRYCNSKAVGITRVNSSPFETRPDTEREFKNFAPSLNEQVTAFRIQEKVLKENYIKELSNEIKCQEVKHNDRSISPERGIVCLAGRFGFSISWDGKMIPCNIFDYAARYPLKEGFQSAWQYINEECKKYKNPVECIGCDYYSVCRSCPAGHYMKVGEGHANPCVCKEGRRMVEENIISL